jgi:Holliday junction resolvasome RuvABC endonuclease subunit
MRFLAIDSSLANTGVAWGEYSEGVFFNLFLGMTSTEKTKNKSVRASSDTIERCAKTCGFIDGILNVAKPDVIFVETPSGSQNSSAAKSYGIVCMLIATLSPSPIQVTPIEVKQATVGKKTASKQEMIDWAYAMHPEAIGWELRNGSPLKKMEHVSDAIAIAYAGILTDEFKRIEKFIK